MMLPRSLAAELRQQVLAARAVGARSASAVRWRGRSACPGDQIPGVGQRWGWFWVFPASSLSVDPRTGVWRRHHVYEERLQRALKKAVAQAGILQTRFNAHLTPQLRHALVAVGHRHSHGAGVAGALGRGNTTMIYTHVLKVAAAGTASPLDSLALHLRPA